MTDLRSPGLRARLASRVVGRDREVELVLAALDAGRHILLEGPPGTGKSTLLRAIAIETGVGFEFVEGNAELTPARLVGHFDPALVLTEGYSPDVFVDGPLVAALRNGSLLYVEELNRVPEETLNALITVMSERELHVPRLGVVHAAPGFRLVAAMNPFDAVGTARISSAVYDRTCRLVVDYQPAADEARVVAFALSGEEPDEAPSPSPLRADANWLAKVVEVVRRTRTHPEVRVGSSVRGAIDTAMVATSLAALRGGTPADPALGLDAALVALSGRIRVREGVARPAEDIIRELWAEVFDPARQGRDEAGDGEAADAGKAAAPHRG
ncbi:MAG TPA: MoxR family ATPase [Acidimicrobiales bacterium]|nr:MoxR family ATPase [Acidimicrobiales bacterium]